MLHNHIEIFHIRNLTVFREKSEQSLQKHNISQNISSTIHLDSWNAVLINLLRFFKTFLKTFDPTS